MTPRNDERTQFLKDILITGVETSGYTPWFQFTDYNPDTGTVTVWHDTDGEGTYTDGPHPVTIENIATALAKFREQVAALPNGGRGTYAYQMVLADRTNGDDGDFDVTTADAVLQIAVLGKEVYA